ncbi:MAG: Gfo/Idh/MocA family oxidoreductase [Defluviitaleaceae bacterium]|nr:Gfo/Idh/MocA family oxidoreductase [Defluviitaleaceae bacterium]
MKKEINVGLLGYKFMGKAHANAYARIPLFFSPDYKINLKAICGRDEKGVAEAAQTFGFEGYETDWQRFTSREDVDVVDITAPSNFHHPVAIKAAENKKHIFCEKPLALTTAMAEEMLAAARENNVKHQIGFNYRFAPAVLLAKKLINEGKLGQIYHFRGAYLQDWIVDPAFPLVWRLDKNVAGSGSHGDLGAHVIDLARFLVGEFSAVIGMSKTFIKERPIVEQMTGLSATAREGAKMGEVTVDDATLFLTQFANGALGSFEATRFSYGHDNDLRFEINGSKGSVRFNLERINELEYFNAEDESGLRGFRTIQVTHPMHPYMDKWWPPGHVIGYEHTFVHELYEFLEAIDKNKKTSPDFYDGVMCCKVLDAVEESVRKKEWVEI